MNIADMRKLFDYNSWANNRLLEAAAQLDPTDYHRDMKSSHGGIHGTLLHVIAAHKVWLARWTGTPDTQLVTDKEFPTRLDLLRLWESVGTGTAHFLAELTDQKLQDTFTMTTSAGKTFTHTYEETLHHLVNHSSVHRGQVVTMIRQLGIKPPATDLIAYLRI